MSDSSLTDDDDNDTYYDSQEIDSSTVLLTASQNITDRMKPRMSDIVLVKKRSPKPLVSSSEDESQEQSLSSSEDEAKEQSSSSSEDKAKEQSSSSLEDVVKEQSSKQNVYNTRSEEKKDILNLSEKIKPAKSRQESKKDAARLKPRDYDIASVRKKSSESISSSEDEVEESSSDQSVHSLYDKESEGEEDVLNLSLKMKNARMTAQFQPGQGILNSTAFFDGNDHRKPGNMSKIQESNTSSSVEVLESDDDVIEISDGEEASSPVKTTQNIRENLQQAMRVAQQRTLMSFGVKREVVTPSAQRSAPRTVTDIRTDLPSTHGGFKRPEPVVLNSQFKPPNPQINLQAGMIGVSPSELEAQKTKIRALEVDLGKNGIILRTINLEALSDKGLLLKQRFQNIKATIESEKAKLAKMVVTKSDPPKPQRPGLANWEELKTGTEIVMPKTFGKTAMSTYNEQKALTLDRLQQLHEAIKSAPKETDFIEDPKGLKIPLMPHQKRALAWLIFREKEKPSGGILADDMGLGKTLTMISLIVKSLYLEKQEENEENEFVGKNTKYKGGTLVICPASLLNQWSGEIDRRLKRGLISYDVFHGTKRETKAKKLADYDVVITTYATANVECNKNGVLSRIKWRRIVLDEAHQIRNHKAQMSVACCSLSAKSRWALTGTPLHNKELDMYALLKFLRCTPFDDLGIFKKWVSSAQERLHTVISSLMLRRTKVELMEKGALECMPSKEWILVKVELDKEEMGVYHKVLIFSRTLFTQFLHQKAEKDQDQKNEKYIDLPNNDPNGEYFKMRQKLLKLNKVKTVSSHEILVLLTRLRQICCHCSLITAMLDGEQQDLGSGDEECEEMNLLDQLQKLNIDDEGDADVYNPSQAAEGIANDEKVTLKEASKGLLNPSHPVFQADRRSSKINVILKVLKEKVLNTRSKDKAILVSQWPSYLRLVSVHLKEEGICFEQLDGSVPVPKRMDMVNRFNDSQDKVRVLLLSLTAGGVGLNLVGANHLFLLDLHWNPQLENQAQDRIYRVGQEKPVFVYKFLATDTIEERIKALQDKKLAMAEGMLTGTKQVLSSKLTLEDMKMIFGIGSSSASQPF